MDGTVQTNRCGTMKVSIIIPVYNLEKYVSKTIESCLGQTYRAIEVIIVNDGSTDGSEKIIEDYLADERVRYVKQDNAGVSAARNHGVEVASGDYITFVDGDDLLAADTIEKNVALIETMSTPIDWLAFPIVRTDENGKPASAGHDQLQDYRYQEVEELNAENVYARYEKGLFPPVVCSMLFRREFFDRRFVDGRYEDTYMFLELLEKRRVVVISPYGAYHYVNRGDSFINAPFSAEKWVAYTRACIKSVKLGKTLFPDRRKEFDRQCTSMYYNLKWVKFKNRCDDDFSKPLCLLESEMPYIRKGGCTSLKYYLKCVAHVALTLCNKTVHR